MGEEIGCIPAQSSIDNLDNHIATKSSYHHITKKNENKKHQQQMILSWAIYYAHYFGPEIID